MPRVRSISIQSEVTCALRLAAAHGARNLDRAAIQQQLLRQRGLAGVRMRNDGKRAPAVGLALHLAVEVWSSDEFCGHGNYQVYAVGFGAPERPLEPVICPAGLRLVTRNWSVQAARA